MTDIAQSAESTRTESDIRHSRRMSRLDDTFARIIREYAGEQSDLETCRQMLLRAVNGTVLRIANERRRRDDTRTT